MCEHLGLEGDCDRELKKHIDVCPECAEYFQSIRDTIRLYNRYSCPDVSERVRKRLHRILKLDS